MIKLKDKKEKKEKTFSKCTFKCPKCSMENHTTVSGYGKHCKKCQNCGELFMIVYEKPEKNIIDERLATFDPKKLDKLPPMVKEKILSQIEEIKEYRKKLEGVDEAQVISLDADGNPIPVAEKVPEILSPKGKWIIDKMISEGFTIDRLDEDAAKIRFSQLIHESLKVDVKNVYGTNFKGETDANQPS